MSSAPNESAANLDHGELAKFSMLADAWWDEHGDCKPLHDLNPLRTQFIAGHVRLEGARVLDVGCGGGILSEAMARLGAQVTGIDANADLIAVARSHAERAGLNAVRYECGQIENLDESQFDVVTCMELLEHVPRPGEIVQACAARTGSGGNVFFSTINRTAKAYAQAVIGAEYILRLLPRGTHDYAKFIRPSELARWCREAGLSVRDITGMSYNPYSGHAALREDRTVNYLAHCSKDD